MLSINLRPDSESWWDRFKARHLVSRNIRHITNRGEIQLGLCEIADELGFIPSTSSIGAVRTSSNVVSSSWVFGGS